MKKMKIVIIGGGSNGLTLANLLGEEHEIVLVEQDEESAKEIAGKTQAMVIQGDGSDISILKKIDLSTVDAIVTTADDKTNLMVCQIAKNEKIKKIVALVKSPKNEELFTQLGITSIVSGVGTNVTALRRLLYQTGEARIIAQLGEGLMQIVEMVISEGSPLIGKPAKLENATLSAIYRAGELIIPNVDTQLIAGDLLLVVAKTKDLPALTNLIEGK